MRKFINKILKLFDLKIIGLHGIDVYWDKILFLNQEYKSKDYYSVLTISKREYKNSLCYTNSEEFIQGIRKELLKQIYNELIKDLENKSILDINDVYNGKEFKLKCTLFI